MSRLREKMQGDLKLAGLCQNTLKTYPRCVAKFSSYFGKSPVQLGQAQVRAFLLDLIVKRRVGETSRGLSVVGVMTCRVTVEGMAMSGFDEPCGGGFWHGSQRLRLSGWQECLVSNEPSHHPVLRSA